MKVIIPVAGQGKRLRPLTHGLPKALIQVAGKPMLFHVLERVASLEPEEVVLVRSPYQADIEKAVAGLAEPPIRFVVQEEPLGLGHAVWCAGQKLREREVLILLGDTIFDADMGPVLARDEGGIGVQVVDDPSRFGVVRVEGDLVVEMVEKPERPVSRLAIVGIYYVPFFDELQEALTGMVAAGQKRRGEFQITDALNALCARRKFRPFTVRGWYDCGTIEALLETNRRLLEDGSVSKEKSVVGANSKVEGSEVGPYVSIGQGCVVKDSRLTNCILHDEVRVEGCELRDSLVGPRSTLRGVRGQVTVGGDSRLEGA